MGFIIHAFIFYENDNQFFNCVFHLRLKREVVISIFRLFEFGCIKKNQYLMHAQIIRV
jgi:hypothetical protein